MALQWAILLLVFLQYCFTIHTGPEWAGVLRGHIPCSVLVHMFKPCSHCNYSASPWAKLLPSWRGRQCVPPKSQYIPAMLPAVKTQMAMVWTLPAVKIWELVCYMTDLCKECFEYAHTWFSVSVQIVSQCP